MAEASYAFIDSANLGFEEHLQDIDVGELSKATKCLLNDIYAYNKLAKYYRHPDAPYLCFLYGVIFTDSVLRNEKPTPEAELGVYFFTDQQIDRSPTGGGVAARAALAYCKGEREAGTSWAYHSLVSTHNLDPSFMGTIAAEADITDTTAERAAAQVRVRVAGQSFLYWVQHFLALSQRIH